MVCLVVLPFASVFLAATLVCLMREIRRTFNEDYFAARVEAVWEVDPVARTIAVSSAIDRFVTLAAGDTLDGGTMLPGFTLAVADLFAELQGDTEASALGRLRIRV